MPSPSVTLRTIKNEKTGIDISVPDFQEEEAPLGGISILYEISILTRLDVFKTSIHTSNDVVHFSLFKAYREFEDLYNKLQKKFPHANLPFLPKSTSENYSNKKKLDMLNALVKYISEDAEIINSSIFIQFIGVPKEPKPLEKTKKPEISQKPNENIPEFFPKDKTCTESKEQTVSENEDKSTIENITDEDMSDVFPKMKPIAIKKDYNQNANIKEKKNNNKQDKIPANIDLFDEIKLLQNTQEKVDDQKQITPKGLFDEFEEDYLFTSKTKEVNPSLANESIKDVSRSETNKTKVTSPKKPKPKASENVDDSQIIIKERKIGEVSLFQEQDLGDYITKDEESFFLVTSNTEDTRKNSLLFLHEEDSSTETNDNDLNENLEDLLKLEPLPSASVSNKSDDEKLFAETTLEPLPRESGVKKSDGEKPIAEINLEKDLPPKPVPRPRVKSLPKSDNINQKPEVMPRKKFLNDPALPTKPVLPSKPDPPPKPKPKPPPKKPSISALKSTQGVNFEDNTNANVSNIESLNLNDSPDLSKDLNKFDILKYIQQEEKTLEAKPSLFD